MLTTGYIGLLRPNRRIFIWLALFACLSPLVRSQCPQVQQPCHCAPSIYEPVAIVCENAGSLSNALQAINSARNMPVGIAWLPSI